MHNTDYKKLNHSPQLLIFVSDGTGIAAETLGLTIMTQFGNYENAQCETLPFIRTEEDCIKYARVINSWKPSFKEVIVFSTLANANMRKKFAHELELPMFDLFDLMLPKVSDLLKKQINPTIGNRHQGKKEIRAAAIDYALQFDDGQKLNFDEADIIVLGLSRSGKTPTALWMALHYGLNAANYPITDDDFSRNGLPQNIISNLNKCVLLLQTPQRLSEIRQERYKNSNYASFENCKAELNKLKKLPFISDVPQIDVSNKSVEEIAAAALMKTNIHPKGRF